MAKSPRRVARRLIISDLLLVIILAGACLGFYKHQQSIPVKASTLPTVTVTPESSTGHPWVGLGTEWDDDSEDQGTPLPLTSTQWNTIFSRVDYMHLSIMRSMINVGWFCPSGTVGTYTFDSPLMQAWYTILDHAKADNITVMIGTWDAGSWSATSPAYANAMADLVSYLITTKGYTNIKYFNALNEPDYQPVPLAYTDWQTMITNVNTAFVNKGLAGQISLVGPDTNGNWVSDGTVAQNAQNLLGGYEWHNYVSNGTSLPNDTVESSLRNIVQTLSAKDPSNKPTLLGEMALSYQDDYPNSDNQPHVVDYSYGLNMADYAVQLARAGVGGGSAWDLDDAMHNKEWGMWDIVNSPQLRPWFYSWSLLTRYLPAHATIYAPTVSVSGLRFLAARIPDPAHPGNSHWTLVFVNSMSSAATLNVNVPYVGSGTFNQYTYTNGNNPVDANGFPIPSGQVNGTLSQGMNVTVPATSMLLLTTLDGASLSNQTSLTITDPLNDWSYTASHTSGWAFDSTNPAYFDGDTSRLKRTSDTTQDVVYAYHGLQGFSAKVYYYQALNGNVHFYSSKDEINWTALPATNDVPVATQQSWYRTNFTPSGGIPVGTNYLKVEFSNDPNIFTPQLSQISLTYMPDIIVDPLNDWSYAYSRSANWYLDASNAAYFDGDTSRAVRQTFTSENIVYQYPNLTSFSAKVYYWNNLSTVNVYVSSDGSNWSQLPVIHDQPVATQQSWYHTTFTPSVGIPGGTNYLKIEFAASTGYNWTPQLSQMTLLYMP